MSKYSRRDILSLLGSGTLVGALHDPITDLARIIVEGLITQAKADASGGASPMNYVAFFTNGGRPSYHNDLLITPYGTNHPDMAHEVNHPSPSVPGAKMFVTRIGQNHAAGIDIYQPRALPVTDYFGNQIYGPDIFLTPVPTTSGTAYVYDIMKNAVFIRGIRSDADGHPRNAALQTRPVANEPSISGLVADRSQTPMAAVGSYGSPVTYYRSKSGVAIQTLGGSPALDSAGNWFNKLLEPFNPASFNNTLLARRRALASVDVALDIINDYISSGHPGASELRAQRIQAESLLYQGIGTLANEYFAYRDRYRNLVESSKGLEGSVANQISRIPGVTDYAVNAPLTHARRYTLHGGARLLLQNADLRSVITPSSNWSHFVQSFALIEFVLANRLSSSISVTSQDAHKLHYELPGGVVTEDGFYNMDEHEYGRDLSVVMNAWWYRSFAACLLEMSKGIGTEIWNNTLFHNCTDFGRNQYIGGNTPAEALSGSDHGWESHSVSLFSGAITQFMNLGNLRVQSGSSAYPGTWKGAKVNGRWISPATVAKTICEILGVHGIAENEHPMIVRSPSGQLVPTTGTPKNVYETGE